MPQDQNADPTITIVSEISYICKCTALITLCADEPNATTLGPATDRLGWLGTESEHPGLGVATKFNEAGVMKMNLVDT